MRGEKRSNMARVFRLEVGGGAGVVGTPRTRKLARFVGLVDAAGRSGGGAEGECRSVEQAPVLEVRNRCGLGAEETVDVGTLADLAAAAKNTSHGGDAPRPPEEAGGGRGRKNNRRPKATHASAVLADLDIFASRCQYNPQHRVPLPQLKRHEERCSSNTAHRSKKTKTR
mmetsp:Transcript_11018/g.23620  ORF Transcript_11018/g.23620 Transcript_11018/m.23620 type:complete len:170 (+) Transcript_11018:253-762(+)